MMMLFRRRFLAAAAALVMSAGIVRSGAAVEGRAYAFTFEAIEGHSMPLSDFRGKVMLVVNTASMCGFTPQYRALQDLWETYGERGLVVIGVPSGDFGGQEYDSSNEIKEFCEVNFNVTFPLAEKEHVTGANAHPFYRWARDELGSENAPGWNFHKYLVDRDGRLVTSFSTRIRPDDPAVVSEIERLLGDSAA